MLVRKTYTVTYERDGQRIRDQVAAWLLFGLIPLYRQNTELWRKSAAELSEIVAGLV